MARAQGKPSILARAKLPSAVLVPDPAQRRSATRAFLFQRRLFWKGPNASCSPLCRGFWTPALCGTALQHQREQHSMKHELELWLAEAGSEQAQGRHRDLSLGGQCPVLSREDSGLLHCSFREGVHANGMGQNNPCPPCSRLCYARTFLRPGKLISYVQEPHPSCSLKWCSPRSG